MCDSNPTKRTRVRYESPDEQASESPDVTFCFGFAPVTCKLDELPKAIKTNLNNTGYFYKNINFYIEGWDRVVSHQPDPILRESEDYCYVFTKGEMKVILHMSTTQIFEKLGFYISCKGF